MVQALAVAFLSLLIPQEKSPDEERFNRLVDRLGADFLEEREAARQSLEEAGPKAAPVLIAALGRADFRVRKACVELLTSLKDEAAIQRVGEVYGSDEDSSVRDAAFEYLKAAGRPAEGFLIAALASDRADHRREAAKALTEFRSGKAADAMGARYKSDPDKAVREQAFEYLKTVGKPAERLLLEILASPDPAVRRGALAGLRKVQVDEKTQSDEALAAVARAFAGEADAGTLKEAFEYLQAAGPRAEACFVEGLRSKQDTVRSHSLDGLRDLKSERVVDAVAGVFLEDSSEEVRRRAGEFLKAQGPKAEDALIRGLSSGNPKVRLAAIPLLGEIRSVKPLDRISLMFREDRDAEVHRAAFDYLKGIGAPAEKDLVQALSDADKRIRLEAIRALGLAKSRAAIEPLIDFMTQLEPETRRAAEDALVHIGRPAVDAVLKAVESGRLKKRAGEAILSSHHAEEVERLLDALITPEGGSGFYAGMFKPVESLGKEKALPALLKMAVDRSYAWRLPETDPRERPPDWIRKMQELAVMAVGEMGDASAVPPLLEALKGTVPSPADDIHEELVVALHRLGEKKPFEEYAARALSRAEEAFKADNVQDGCDVLFQLGLAQGRVGRSKESEETYLRLLKAVEDRKLTYVDRLPVVYYNLACLGALRGEKGRALEWLRKAVESGFRDREWIRRDRDLDSLRNEEGYTRLLSDEKLFEKKAGP